MKDFKSDKQGYLEDHYMRFMHQHYIVPAALQYELAGRFLYIWIKTRVLQVAGLVLGAGLTNSSPNAMGPIRFEVFKDGLRQVVVGPKPPTTPGGTFSNMDSGKPNLDGYNAYQNTLRNLNRAPKAKSCNDIRRGYPSALKTVEFVSKTPDFQPLTTVTQNIDPVLAAILTYALPATMIGNDPDEKITEQSPTQAAKPRKNP
ncbi:MAG: hypothetical protein R3A45_03870 [Bdellovibrionota bacterium]